jgi:hypothetical protein
VEKSAAVTAPVGHADYPDAWITGNKLRARPIAGGGGGVHVNHVSRVRPANTLKNENKSLAFLVQCDVLYTGAQ